MPCDRPLVVVPRYKEAARLRLDAFAGPARDARVDPATTHWPACPGLLLREGAAAAAQPVTSPSA